MAHRKALPNGVENVLFLVPSSRERPNKQCACYARYFLPKAQGPKSQCARACNSRFNIQFRKVPHTEQCRAAKKSNPCLPTQRSDQPQPQSL
jgi:hypothetical protein